MLLFNAHPFGDMLRVQSPDLGQCMVVSAFAADTNCSEVI